VISVSLLIHDTVVSYRGGVLTRSFNRVVAGRRSYARVPKGLLPLTADPIHYGHLNLIQQAGGRCDKLLTMMSVNPDKAPILKDDDRLKLTRKCVTDFCPELFDI